MKRETVDRISGDASPPPLFDGGGELGARMRALDWSKTALGPVDRWPQSLKTCVRIVLTSRQPMFVWWGEDLITATSWRNGCVRPTGAGRGA